jgi:hypothetical protein
MKNGDFQWYASDFVEFHVTGVDRAGKRFKQAHKTWFMANAINLWNGTVWGVTPDGKRRRLKRVTN